MAVSSPWHTGTGREPSGGYASWMSPPQLGAVAGSPSAAAPFFSWPSSKRRPGGASTIVRSERATGENFMNLLLECEGLVEVLARAAEEQRAMRGKI